MATANLSNVVVAVDCSKESMKALRWALDSLRLRPDGALIVLHVLAAELPTGTIRYSCKILSIDEHFDGAKILHLAHGSTLRERCW
ncbi:Peptidyl-prolyl isomerase FKBP12 [Hordeum vulgare]|nr:Peptidyl-prolyl isomerase FKBP12 [Hordeum vulgare]